jgi:hypothetical protein
MTTPCPYTDEFATQEGAVMTPSPDVQIPPPHGDMTRSGLTEEQRKIVLGAVEWYGERGNFNKIAKLLPGVPEDAIRRFLRRTRVGEVDFR